MVLKVIFANSVDPDQTAPLEQPDLGPHCLPVCKNRFEKFARIFSRRHEQTTFSDAVFLGALRVKGEEEEELKQNKTTQHISEITSDSVSNP